MDIPNFPNDRDYFMDENESIYQVLGYQHPPDSIYCLKKYQKILETTESKAEFFWYSKMNDSLYERVITSYSSKNAAANIAENQYCKFSELYGVNFIVFPRIKVLHYFSPIEKLNELSSRFDNEKFKALAEMMDQENVALEISYILSNELGIPKFNLGVTGSFLWGGVHEHSDIDIVIYGVNNTLKFIKNAYRLPAISSRLRKLNTSEMIAIGNKFSRKTGLSMEDCVVFTSRKPYLFYYEKYFLSIAFSPLEREIENNPLASKSTQFVNEKGLTNVIVQAEVTDIDWGYFYPAVVNIKNVKLMNKSQLKGSKNLNICRILIFERESSGYFTEGDNIEIKGLIQRIENPSPKLVISEAVTGGYDNSEDKIYHQIVIGTKENYGNEYIRNLKL